MEVDASILISCYGKEDYINECMQSILRQTKRPKEVIIVHDGCESPITHAKAVSIILPENMGVAFARKEAFRFSTGKLILFLDGDDVLSPDCLEKMILTIADGGDIAYPDIYFWSDLPSLAEAPKEINPALVERLKKVPIPISSLMKREVFEKVGGFRNWDILEDFDFWIRAMCKGYTFKHSNTLFWYRQDGGRHFEATRKNKYTKIRDEILSQFNFIKGEVVLKDG